MLNIKIDLLPTPDCNELNKWKKEIQADKITLIFPSAYLGSASSMFGHLFLRFDSISNEDKLLSKTVNYAALNSRDNTTNQFYGGLFTGLPAVFSIKPYYLKLREYAFMENRDMWEFELAFNKNEVNFLILHLWELRNNAFDYYFIDENCAYRMLAFLEAGKPDIDATRHFQTTAVPSGIITALDKADLIAKTTYRPSAKKRFHRNASHANSFEVELIKDIVLGRATLQSQEYRRLRDERKAIVLSLAAEYLALLISEDKLDRNKSHALRHLLITEQAKFQKTSLFGKVQPNIVSPDKGHAARKVSMQRLKINNNYITSFKYRYAYHNLHDPMTGFEKGSQIETMKFDIRNYVDGIKLHQFDLFDIKSYSPASEFFSPVSWSIAVGLSRNIVNNNELGLYAKSRHGKTYKFRNSLLYGLGVVSFQQGQHYNNGHVFGAGIQIGSLYYFDHQTLELNIEAVKNFSGENFNELMASLEYSFSISTISSIDIYLNQSTIDKFKSEEAGLQFNYFF